MDLQITYTDEFPESLKASAEKCLRDGIAFLESIPRPTTLPEIEFLTPDFSEMEFQFGVDTWPHGLFSRTSMKGWCVLSYKASGDLLINSEPVVTVVGVDPNICTTASIVYTLDQYFIAGTYPEIHLHRQLQYLDSIAASNKAVRSLLDQYEESQSEKEQAEKDAEHKAQLELKQYNRARKYAHDTALRLPLWWLERWPDSPQSLEGEFLVTQSGHPIGTSDQWRNGELSPPTTPANVAAQRAMQSKEPGPFVPSTAEEDAEAFMRMQAAAMGHASPTSCEDYDR